MMGTVELQRRTSALRARALAVDAKIRRRQEGQQREAHLSEEDRVLDQSHRGKRGLALEFRVYALHAEH